MLSINSKGLFLSDKGYEWSVSVKIIILITFFLFHLSIHHPLSRITKLETSLKLAFLINRKMRAPNKRIKVKLDQNKVTFPCTRKKPSCVFLGGSLFIFNSNPRFIYLFIYYYYFAYLSYTIFAFIFRCFLKVFFTLKKYKIDIFKCFMIVLMCWYKN
jgi:hypothetical protein